VVVAVLVLVVSRRRRQFIPLPVTGQVPALAPCWFSFSERGAGPRFDYL
jgi:hypothetical protein